MTKSTSGEAQVIVNFAIRRIAGIAAGVLAAATLSSTISLPASAVDCYPPGSCTPTTPEYHVVKAELALGTTAAESCVNEACTPVEVVKTVNESSVKLTIGNSTITIAPLTANGSPRQISDSGQLVITTASGVTVTVTGLKPGSWVDVFLNSAQIFLGKAKVGADGTLRATLPLPKGMEAGLHTVQVAGTTPAGAVISASLGVLVAPVALSATAARYVLVAGKPGAATSKTLLAGHPYQITAGLASTVTGNWLTPAKAKALGKCSSLATVKSIAGKVLLKPTCMQYSTKNGKAYLNWFVPSEYSGKVKITFRFTEQNRKDSTRTQGFTIRQGVSK